MSGEYYTPAYQMSGTPWVTASNIDLGQINRHRFGNVTRFFTVKNLGDVQNGAANSIIAIGFTENAFKQENHNCIFLLASESFGAEIRTDRIYVSGVAGPSFYNVVAGLTSILPRDFQVITGSNGFQGVG